MRAVVEPRRRAGRNGPLLSARPRWPPRGTEPVKGHLTAAGADGAWKAVNRAVACQVVDLMRAPPSPDAPGAVSAGGRLRLAQTSRGARSLHDRSSRSRPPGSAPATSTIFVRLVVPATSVTASRRTPNAEAAAVSAAAVARPSTARSLARTTSAPSCSLPTPGRAEPGRTRTVTRTTSVCAYGLAAAEAGRREGGWRGFPRVAPA